MNGAEREVELEAIREFKQLIADAFLPFIQAVNQSEYEMRRLLEASEQLRMKLIGRRHQAIFALLVVLVYLAVRFLA